LAIHKADREREGAGSVVLRLDLNPTEELDTEPEKVQGLLLDWLANRAFD
jgi:hypothetical protein